MGELPRGGSSGSRLQGRAEDPARWTRKQKRHTGSVKAPRTESRMSLNARKGAGRATRQDGKAVMHKRSRRTETLLASRESRGGKTSGGERSGQI